MKVFVQYLHPSAIDPDKLIPVCGDRGVVILDGRNNIDTWVADAHNFNGYRRPIYHGFIVCRGNFHKYTPVYSWVDSAREWRVDWGMV